MPDMSEMSFESEDSKQVDTRPHWYVVHTYSGYENKVKGSIEKTIENRKLQDQILEVAVPMQDVVEVKNGAQKDVKKKLFPGYVLIHMIMNDDTWYVVRNTRGVTGFVGPGSKPVPLTEDELLPLRIQKKEMAINFHEGDMVKITAGSFRSYVGEISKVDAEKGMVTVYAEMFAGSKTALEIPMHDIEKM